MKWFFRLTTMAMLLGAIAFPFFMKNKQGEPMMALPGMDSLSMPKMPAMPVVRTVYKWQDAEGVWHYGDAPPPDASFKTIEVNDQTNVIQMFTEDERNKLAPPAPAEVPAVAAGPGVEAPKPLPDDGLTVERALNIMNEAKEVRSQMEARNRELDRISGGQ